ncbi:MAG: poly-gamma-glutamate synthase PgsB [Candidatus Aminicenantes bacterium]|nr:poly-gamma-glutamate synthase PgsB [Candidatus Aminicenantes bacterium]
MDLLILDLVILAGFLGFLFIEKWTLGRRRRRLPLVICVTGTRGKSTVTRQIAAAFRAAGRTVVGKTTGSKPVLILPDGSEREIMRPGMPTILEQKRILAAAARLRADTLVAEMMSIGPECLAAESGKILRPDILVLTNVRLDHEEEMGRTEEGIAGSLAAAISPGCAVLFSEDEFFPAFERAARTRSARLVKIPAGVWGDLLPGFDFPENVRLSLAAAEQAGLDRETALKGIAGARPDFGGLKTWSLSSPLSGRIWTCASLFAANDPESTRIALERIRMRGSFGGKTTIALLNLRADRESRTRRWLEAVRAGFFSGIDRIVFIGEQASALGRMRFPRPGDVPAVLAVSGKTAVRVMSALWPMSAEETVVIGIGNIAGIGRALVEFWESQGTPVSC